MVAPRKPKRSQFADVGALRDAQVPLVVLDLASVETYLLCQPLTGLARELTWTAQRPGGAIWCPMASAPAPLDLDRELAERVARRIELSLAWPERHPAPVPRAMRVAALACGRGVGAAVIYRLSRLAFGGGGDLDDPAEYLLALTEAGLTAREAMLAAKEGSVWEAELRSLARELAELGISAAPALRWNGRLHLGSRAIAPVLVHSSSFQPPLNLS